jgi:predicted MPP superfamily phosphohydrolase
MLTRLISDLHLDFYQDSKRDQILEAIPAGNDLLVIAGDLFEVGDMGEDDLRQIFVSLRAKAEKTVYVPGNHEYYGSTPANTDRVLGRACADAGVTILRPGVVVDAKEFKVAGSTLWFAERRNTDRAKDYMNDFQQIRDFEPWVYEQNQLARAWVECCGADIIVTHHLPSNRSVPVRFRGSALNRFFVDDCEEIIRTTRPLLWVHGHTHDPADYTLGDTHVLCEPLAYPGERKLPGPYVGAVAELG